MIADKCVLVDGDQYVQFGLVCYVLGLLLGPLVHGRLAGHQCQLDGVLGVADGLGVFVRG